MNLNNTKMEINDGIVVDVKEKKRSVIVVKICDFFISASLFMIFLGLPVFFTSITMQGLFFEKQMYFYFWTLIALVAWAVKGVILEEMQIRKTPLDIPIAGFFIAYVLSSIFSKDHWHSFWGSFGDPSRGLANIIVMIIAYYIIASNFSYKKIKSFLIALLAGNLIIAIWTTLAIFNIKFLPSGVIAPLSLIGSLTSLFTYFSIMIPLAILAALKISQDKSNVFFRVPALVVTIGIIIINLFLIFALLGSAGSWIGLLALLFGVALFLVFILSKIIRINNFSWTWLPMGVFVVVMIFIMSGQFVSVAKINLPIEVQQDFATSWQVATGAIKNNFFVGSGPATYSYDFSMYRPKEINLRDTYMIRFGQGAGIINEIMATTGALGIFFLIILVLSYLSIELYLLSRSKLGDKLYSLGFFVASSVFIINATMLRVEGSILILGALLSALAITTLLKENESLEEYWNFSLKASPKFALALAFIFMVIASGVVFLFVFIGKAFVADVYMRNSVETNKLDIGNALKMDKALSLYSKESQYYVQASQLQLILANQEGLKNKEERNEKNIEIYLGNAIKAGNIAKDLNSNSVAVLENLARVYENSDIYVANSLTLAEDSYKRALELEPHNPNFYLKLAQIKFNLSKSAGKEDQARMISETKDLLQSSIDEKMNFSAGYANLAALHESQNNLDAAIDNMKKAFTVEQQNQDYLFGLGRLYQRRGQGDDGAVAEKIFNNVLKYNDKNINVHFALATLHEKNKQNDQAIVEYGKVADLLPEEQNDLKPQIYKMIENVKSGISNLQTQANESIAESIQPTEEKPEIQNPAALNPDTQLNAAQINP